MKKIYMPSMDELYLMQEYSQFKGMDIYKYLLVKVAESLIVESIHYPAKGILKSAYKYLCEDEYLARIICSLYPEEIRYSRVAQYDTDLCIKLLTKEKSNNIQKLDELRRFSETIQMGLFTIREVIETLAKELPNNPNYRFEYLSQSLYANEYPNVALDSIFSKQLLEHIVSDIIIKDDKKQEELTKIEPAYITDIQKLSTISDTKIKYLLAQGYSSYFDRYFVSDDAGLEYNGSDILTNPDIKVKRLIKCINQNQSNLY